MNQSSCFQNNLVDLSNAPWTMHEFFAGSGLVWEWLRVLDEMPNKPKILLLENVLGLLSTNGGDNYRVLHMSLVERGYRCGAIVLNASHFVPQSRPRVFVIAVQKECEIPEEIVRNDPCWLHN